MRERRFYLGGLYMAITAKMVKELREITGAGMMDCKRALEETNGNIEEAVDYLRKTGSAQAAKKAGRIAAEGSTHIKVEGNQAVLIEVNCETDFVTKNENFQELLEILANHIIQNKPETVEEAMQQTLEGEEETVESFINAKIATIGEKISLRRFALLSKTDEDVFGAYTHMQGSIGVLTLLKESDDESLARDIAMHVAAINPKYVSRNNVPEEEVNREREVLKSQALSEGKPEHIIEKMVEGRLNKFFEDICLVDQAFVKEPDLKIQKLLEQKGTTVETFVRYQVGEGIERREENFAEEVMNQMKK